MQLEFYVNSYYNTIVLSFIYILKLGNKAALVTIFIGRIK